MENDQDAMEVSTQQTFVSYKLIAGHPGTVVVLNV